LGLVIALIINGIIFLIISWILSFLLFVPLLFTGALLGFWATWGIYSYFHSWLAYFFYCPIKVHSCHVDFTLFDMTKLGCPLVVVT
jgi:hypothetical protein